MVCLFHSKWSVFFIRGCLRCCGRSTKSLKRPPKKMSHNAGTATTEKVDAPQKKNPDDAGIQERKFSPKRKFSAGHPCGHPSKNFGQALQILEKTAFQNGHPTRTSMKKLQSEKLRADFLSLGIADSLQTTPPVPKLRRSFFVHIPPEGSI